MNDRWGSSNTCSGWSFSYPAYRVNFYITGNGNHIIQMNQTLLDHKRTAIQLYIYFFILPGSVFFYNRKSTVPKGERSRLNWDLRVLIKRDQIPRVLYTRYNMCKTCRQTVDSESLLFLIWNVNLTCSKSLAKQGHRQEKHQTNELSSKINVANGFKPAETQQQKQHGMGSTGRCGVFLVILNLLR